ncbi:MAG: hypothetical protein HN730_04615 [Bdellovibrionales bacterium]|nr:hypothetical protein [Bdellovibrionales bacterium]
MFFTAFFRSLQILQQDRITLLLSLVPILIGGVLYLLLGKWIYASLLVSGQAWITSTISAGGFGSFLGYLLASLLSIALFFIVNLTFVLIVSLIASPFNDLISGRVEAILREKPTDSLQQSMGKMLAGIVKTLWNEIKKISFLLLITLIHILMGVVPLLVPISIFLATLLLASAFLDYSWCRHNFTFGQCLQNIKSTPITYPLGGLLFISLLSIPLVNLLAYPLATIYFTTLFVLNHRD